MKFYDRENELTKLTVFEKQAEKNLSFLRITGRRRIGKTLLIRKFMENSPCPALYFFVTKKVKPLLDEYATIIADSFPEYSNIAFYDFEQFLSFLFNLMKHKKLIVVFDEFQNFKYVDNAVFSILQKHIDLNKDSCGGLLLVIGSINSMMRHIFDDYSKPLYGRLNGNFLLTHFSIETISQILADHGCSNNETLLFYYSLFQGIPFYYNYISQRQGFAKSRADLLTEDILGENSILLNEGKEILLEEFGKDYSTYFSILEAMASGATTLSRISDFSGIPVNNLGRYITELSGEHELIRRQLPFDSKKTSKHGRYYIRDNFLDFWFRYIFKNQSRLEILSSHRMAAEILADFPVFMGKKFEKLVISHLTALNRRDQIRFDRIGSYWDRGKTEIDIIYANDLEKKIHFCECKLSKKRFSRAALSEKVTRFLQVHRQYKDWEKVLEFYSLENWPSSQTDCHH